MGDAPLLDINPVRAREQVHTRGSLCRKQPHLCAVWQEDRTGKVTGDTAQQVDDGDAVPAGQFLQVPQDSHLEADGHEAVQDPVGGGGIEQGSSTNRGQALLGP